jgi:hypothetical protein
MLYQLDIAILFFGIVTLDWLIIVPNGLGAILGFVQVPVARVEKEKEESSSPTGDYLEQGVDTDMSIETMPDHSFQSISM